jgi:hypothetical protein
MLLKSIIIIINLNIIRVLYAFVPIIDTCYNLLQLHMYPIISYFIIFNFYTIHWKEIDESMGVYIKI